MEHLTRGAVATFTPLAAKKGLSFEFSIDEAAKGTFLGDAVRIRQILYNLAANAVKFTETGGVGVCVSYADGALTLEVADSGVGIAPERIDGLFGGSCRATPRPRAATAASGLGLAICRSLAELMGGTIQVSQRRGQGLAVHRHAADGAAGRAGADRRRRAAAAPRGRAADPHPGRRGQCGEPAGAEDPAQPGGLEPTVVENGAEAVEAWKSGRWDVILMDIQMPVMDGVTATREIRACEAPATRPRTPIIAVTANAMSHQVADYAAAGMDAVVPKPLDAAGCSRPSSSASDGQTEPALGRGVALPHRQLDASPAAPHKRAGFGPRGKLHGGHPLRRQSGDRDGRGRRPWAGRTRWSWRGAGPRWWSTTWAVRWTDPARTRRRR
jgi:CheY-like chemotaxis protein